MERSAFTVVRPRASYQWIHSAFAYPLNMYPNIAPNSLDQVGGYWQATNGYNATTPYGENYMWQGFSCPPLLLQPFTPAFERAVAAIYKMKMEWHVFHEVIPNTKLVWCTGGDIDTWGAAAVLEWWALNNPNLTKLITIYDDIVDTATTTGRKSLTMSIFQLGYSRIYLAVCSYGYH